jgi:hypothetical protein
MEVWHREHSYTLFKRAIVLLHCGQMDSFKAAPIGKVFGCTTVDIELNGSVEAEDVLMDWPCGIFVLVKEGAAWLSDGGGWVLLLFEVDGVETLLAGRGGGGGGTRLNSVGDIFDPIAAGGLREGGKCSEEEKDE